LTIVNNSKIIAQIDLDGGDSFINLNNLGSNPNPFSMYPLHKEYIESVEYWSLDS